MKKSNLKNKFVLSTDLVSVEPEPVLISDAESKNLPKNQTKTIKVLQEQLSLKISSEIKKNFQVWCVRNNKTMKDALEECLDEYVKNRS